MSQPLRIAFVCRHFPPERIAGGIATYTATLARALVALGHDVSVICEGGPGVELEEGVRVVRAKPHNARWLCRRPVGWLRPYDRFGYISDWLSWSYAVHIAARQIQDQWGLDIVESPEYMAQGWVGMHSDHYPTVVKLHGPAQLVFPANGVRESLSFRFAARLETQAARKAAFVTSPSAAMADWGIANWRLQRRSVRVIPNAIDEQSFRPLLFRGSTSEEKIALYVGRIERNKGVAELLNAFAIVMQQVSPVRLLVAGASNWYIDGKLCSISELLDSLAVQQDVRERVLWLGSVPRSLLTLRYQSSTICVCPTLKFDNFPYTCLEAMACGRPVVGTSSGGMSEMIEHGVSGFLVPPGKVDELAQALLEVFQSPELAETMGTAARKRVEALYSRQIIANQTLDLYREVIETKTP